MLSLLLRKTKQNSQEKNKTKCINLRKNLRQKKLWTEEKIIHYIEDEYKREKNYEQRRK